MVDFLFVPLDVCIPANPEFESMLENVRQLLEHCGNGVHRFMDQANIAWDLYNDWLGAHQEGKEKLIVALGNGVIDLAKNAAQAIKLAVNGFRFNNLCNLVVSVIEGHFSILQTSKTGLAIFVTGLEFYRVCVDLYQYRRTVSKDSVPSFYRHAYKGAQFMDVTWRNYGTTLFTLFRNLNNITYSELIFKAVFANKRVEKKAKDTNYWSEAIAVADYAYCESKKHPNPPYVPLAAYSSAISEIPTDEKGHFRLDRNLNGAVVELQQAHNSIWLGFTGSNSCSHILTDVMQIMGGPNSVYYAAVGITRYVVERYKNKKIIVTGHSLGGGLTQFAVSSLMDSNIQGIGFNSAGLSEQSMALLKRHQVKLVKEGTHKQSDINMTHIVMKHDIVSTFGALVGKINVVDSRLRYLKAHKLDNVNKTINPNGPTYISLLNNPFSKQ